MLNLAVKSFGAPSFIALSRKLAADWLYARTRNPMLLAGLAFLLSVGIWFQSAMPCLESPMAMFRNPNHLWRRGSRGAAVDDRIVRAGIRRTFPGQDASA